MSAFVVLVLAALSRILPHSLHLVGWNFTALGGGLLFFGSRMRGTRGQVIARLAAALAVLIATDYYLTVFAYALPWHTSAYLLTWIWYAAICLLGMGLLQRPGVLRCAAAILASATSFFLLSNGAVWAGSGMYPHTLAGLGTALAMGLPFYRNDLTSTTLTVGVLFGLPALARRMAQSLDAARHDHLA
ncbi:MAG TPA: DUF6580 family putative transport protein [Acidobacteriaceae bacterium]|nr:DUF6580 family putative transport protein [Acidobacteriaceae bacterium]